MADINGIVLHLFKHLDGSMLDTSVLKTKAKIGIEPFRPSVILTDFVFHQLTNSWIFLACLAVRIVGLVEEKTLCFIPWRLIAPKDILFLERKRSTIYSLHFLLSKTAKIVEEDSS